MEKEKQIEEMIKAMSVYIPTPDDEIRAKLLYAAGYGNVKEAVKEFAEWVKKKIEIDKYTPEITKDYDDEDKNNCEYYNLGLNHAQIIIDFFVKEVCGEK